MAALTKFVTTEGNDEPTARLDVPGRLEAAKGRVERFSSPGYRASLVGTLGLQPELV